MQVNTRTLLVSLAWAAIICACARADEITLKNGNVIEGKIVEETPDKIVMETDFGKITIRRSQIESIKRYRGPTGYEKIRPKGDATVAPPPGAEPIPGIEGHFVPPDPPWAKADALSEGGKTYRLASKGILEIRKADTGGDFMKYLHGRKKSVAGGARLIWDQAYFHCGRRAFEMSYESRQPAGILTREFIIDANGTGLIIRLSGPESGIASGIPGYLELRDSVRIPVRLPGGRMSASKPFFVRTPLVTNMHVPPVGAWKFKKQAEEGTHILNYSRDGESEILVMIGFWDGHGKVAVEVLDTSFRKIRVLSLADFTLKNGRYDDMGSRVEYSADCTASILGVPCEGKIHLVHEGLSFIAVIGMARPRKKKKTFGILEKMVESVEISKDWTEAMEPSYWRDVTVQEGGVRFKVPAWWRRDGQVWLSPGGTALLVESGPMPGPLPDAGLLRAYLAKVRIPNYERLSVKGSVPVEIQGKTGIRVDIEGIFRMGSHRFEVGGEIMILRFGKRFFHVLLVSPKPGLEKQKTVLEKLRNSIRFE